MDILEKLKNAALEASRDAEFCSVSGQQDWRNGRQTGFCDALGVVTGHYWYYDSDDDKLCEDVTLDYQL